MPQIIRVRIDFGSQFLRLRLSILNQNWFSTLNQWSTRSQNQWRLHKGWKENLVGKSPPHFLLKPRRIQREIGEAIGRDKCGLASSKWSFPWWGIWARFLYTLYTWIAGIKGSSYKKLSPYSVGLLVKTSKIMSKRLDYSHYFRSFLVTFELLVDLCRHNFCHRVLFEVFLPNQLSATGVLLIVPVVTFSLAPSDEI